MIIKECEITSKRKMRPSKNYLVGLENESYALVKWEIEVVKDLGYEFDHCDVEYFEDEFDSVIRVNKDGCVGYLDKNGEPLISPDYYDITFYGCGGRGRVALAIEGGGGMPIIIDAEGRVLVPPGYESMCFACGGTGPDDPVLFIVRKKEKYGVIDQDGNVIIPLEYDILDMLGNGSFYGENSKGGARFGRDGRPCPKITNK